MNSKTVAECLNDLLRLYGLPAKSSLVGVYNSWQGPCHPLWKHCVARVRKEAGMSCSPHLCRTGFYQACPMLDLLALRADT